MRRALSIAVTGSFLELAIPETQFIVSNTNKSDVTTVSQKRFQYSRKPVWDFHQYTLNLTEVNGEIDKFF